MTVNEILAKVDHTLLDRRSSLKDILAIVDDGIHFGTASVCIPPCYVKEASDYAMGRVKICTVIGFPNGYSHKDIKIAEAKRAILDGAEEIDTVINLCDLNDGRYDKIEDELKELKAACGDKTLKVIVETCLLSEEEKVKICRVVSRSGADYIKTSTGFSVGGATREDVALFARHKNKELKIKAAGGISSLKDAEDFISLGADRLGTSRVVKIVKGDERKSDY